jgi:hypothetical protein
MKNSKLFAKLNEGYEKVQKTIENLNTLLLKYTEIISNLDSVTFVVQDLYKPFSYIEKTFSDLKTNFKDYHQDVINVYQF